METYSTPDIIRILQKKQVSFFSLADFGRLFNIGNQQTLYKKIQRLEEKNIIQRLIKGKYRFLLSPGNDFTLANFLYQPSYISLESALSFYGIITGFSYQITSVLTNKTRFVNIDGKDFQYCQISSDLFWGYEKKDEFLIADKEKALLDYIYFSLKGLRSLDWEEIDLSEIDKSKMAIYLKKVNKRKMTEVFAEKIIL